MPITPGNPIAAITPVPDGGDIFDRVNCFNGGAMVIIDPVRATSPEEKPIVLPDALGP